MTGDARRALPSVDALLRHPTLQPLLDRYSRTIVTSLVRQTIAVARAAGQAPHPDAVAAQIVATAEEHWRVGPLPVINATGVLLHTNLGRAPLSAAAIDAATAVASGYSNLEYDLATGRRGTRHAHLGALLSATTGAEDGLAVNNTAAALVLVLAALCRRRDVLVSRGQAVEIGGGFRIPTILRESGAHLVEVGTTNKTRLADYADALTPRSGAILRVHTSNFKIVGFTSEVALADLGALARERGVTLIDDVGSGSLLDLRPYGLAHEPLVQESVASGADLVLFSGDKLLGGPQAGLIVGRTELMNRLRAHALMRVLRPDKITIAALGATLLHYLRGEAVQALPIWRMIAATQGDLEQRAQGWATALPPSSEVEVAVEAGESTVGGGALPGETLPTALLTLRARRRPSAWASASAAALRQGQPAVVARIERDRLCLDPRTVLPEQERALLECLRALCAATPHT